MSLSNDRGIVVEASANSVTGSEPSNPVSCGATAETTSGTCSSTGPTDSKNGSVTGADFSRCGFVSRCGSTPVSTGPTDSKNGSSTGDSSRCGSMGVGRREGLDFGPFNRLKAPPAFGNGNAVFRTGEEFHGFSCSETCRGPPAKPLPCTPVAWAGAVLALRTAVSALGSGREEPGTENLYP